MVFGSFAPLHQCMYTHTEIHEHSIGSLSDTNAAKPVMTKQAKCCLS